MRAPNACRQFTNQQKSAAGARAIPNVVFAKWIMKHMPKDADGKCRKGRKLYNDILRTIATNGVAMLDLNTRLLGVHTDDER